MIFNASNHSTVYICCSHAEGKDGARVLSRGLLHLSLYPALGLKHQLDVLTFDVLGYLQDTKRNVFIQRMLCMFTDLLPLAHVDSAVQ